MDALLEKIAMHPYWSQPQHMVGLAFVIGFSIALIVTIISCVRKIERCRVKIEAEIIDNVKRMRTDEDGHRYACYVPSTAISMRAGHIRRKATDHPALPIRSASA